MSIIQEALKQIKADKKIKIVYITTVNRLFQGTIVTFDETDLIFKLDKPLERDMVIRLAHIVGIETDLESLWRFDHE